MKVVLDTMMWVSYCTRASGTRHQVIVRALKHRVRFFVSEYILSELAAVLLEDLGRTPRFVHLARRAVLRIAKLVTLPPHVNGYVPRDPDDDPIVQTALAANVDYLVTADSALIEVAKVNNISIITLTQFELTLPPLA